MRRRYPQTLLPVNVFRRHCSILNKRFTLHYEHVYANVRFAIGWFRLVQHLQRTPNNLRVHWNSGIYLSSRSPTPNERRIPKQRPQFPTSTKHEMRTNNLTFASLCLTAFTMEDELQSRSRCTRWNTERQRVYQPMLGPYYADQRDNNAQRIDRFVVRYSVMNRQPANFALQSLIDGFVMPIAVRSSDRRTPDIIIQYGGAVRQH